ncbi:peptidoglycan-binding protein [Jiella sp. M17.18]|uniref:peptidoglycan-binding protein n=1 Tax=Jiella sp. M17.18 TaxID=3234247 RepID=UPI0034DEB10E
MRHTSLALSTALAAVLAVGTAQAQSTQQNPTAGTAGRNAPQVSNQRLAQEVARYKGSEIYLSTAGTRQIQQALNKKGYDVGSVDGQWNKQTARAAANFEQAQGLEPTGSLTVSLVEALGLTNILNGQGITGQGASNQRLAQETANGKGAILKVSPAGVRVVQQTLNAQGYDPGRVNGLWTKATSRAAANFQQANGLEPTGVLDVSLLKALGDCQRVFSAGNASASANGNNAGNGSGNGGSSQRIAQETTVGGTPQKGNTVGNSGSSGQQQAGTPLYISPAGVRQLTQKLNALGYDAGSVDGQWDKQTATATANFQQAKGLEPTGTLTTEFLAAAGLNQWLPTQACSASTASQGSGSQGLGNQASGGANSGGANRQAAAGAGGIQGMASANGSATQAATGANGSAQQGGGNNGLATASVGAGNAGTGAGTANTASQSAANAGMANGSNGTNAGAPTGAATGNGNAGLQASNGSAQVNGAGASGNGINGEAKINPNQQQASINTLSQSSGAGGAANSGGANGASGAAAQTGNGGGQNGAAGSGQTAATGAQAGASAGAATGAGTANGQQTASLGQNGQAGASQQPREGATVAVSQSATGRQKVSVRNLLQYDVVGANGKKVGNIERIINMKNRLYAVAGHGGFLGIGEQKTAIPLSSLVLQNQALVAPKLTKNQAQSLQGVPQNGYSELNPNTQVTIGTM